MSDALETKWNSVKWSVGMPLPEVGSEVELAGVNTDVTCDQDRKFSKVTVVGYSRCGCFGCFQVRDCWPTVEKLTNCWFRPS